MSMLPCRASLYLQRKDEFSSCKYRTIEVTVIVILCVFSRDFLLKSCNVRLAPNRNAKAREDAFGGAGPNLSRKRRPATRLKYNNETGTARYKRRTDVVADVYCIVWYCIVLYRIVQIVRRRTAF